MTKKKIISLFLCLVLILSFASCSLTVFFTKENPNENEGESQSQQKKDSESDSEYHGEEKENTLSELETEQKDKQDYENGILYVSTRGNDDNPGTYSQPFLSLDKAKDVASTFEKGKKVLIFLRGGRYNISETIRFLPTDHSNITISSYPGEKAILSGSTPLTDFNPEEVNDVLAYTLMLPKDFEIHSLFNEKHELHVTRYPSEGYFYANSSYPDSSSQPDGNAWSKSNSTSEFFTDKEDAIKDYSMKDDILLRVLHFWIDDTAYLKDISGTGFKVRLSRNLSKSVSGGDRYFYENVFEELNEPGEWYYDKTINKLYYIPFEGERYDTLTLYAGTETTLIELNNFSHATFRDLTFTNNNWELRSRITQGGTMVRGAIETSYCYDINIESCVFKDLDSTAIRFLTGTKNSVVTGCQFTNIAGSAFYATGLNDQLGSARTVSNITFENNDIYKYGRRYYCAVGILLGFVDTAVITHNSICDGFYSAISVGWSWGYNYQVTNHIEISNNLIENIGQEALSDMGGIYTLGVQEGTIITNNVIHDVHAYKGPGGYGGWGIYLDEGSSYIEVKKNLVYDCGSEEFYLHYGSTNKVENNIFAFGYNCILYGLNNNADTRLSTFCNNILLTEGKSNIFRDFPSKKTVIANNLFWDLKGANIEKTIQTYIQNGVIDSSNKTSVDPELHDPLERDFSFTNTRVEEYGIETWDIYDVGPY